MSKNQKEIGKSGMSPVGKDTGRLDAYYLGVQISLVHFWTYQHINPKFYKTRDISPKQLCLIYKQCVNLRDYESRLLLKPVKKEMTSNHPTRLHQPLFSFDICLERRRISLKQPSQSVCVPD